jgi:glycosyltransferase involved in cell wall biosynthesis
VQISVLICTHNPRKNYLERVLAGLRQQTLPRCEWELLLIDNASDVPLENRIDISWHPSARHVREAELGLTPARLRGIREAKGSIIIFVDDDNVLSDDYLAEAQNIGDFYPYLGAWGAGIIRPEFESPPPRWAEPYLPYLALHELEFVRWSNSINDWEATPVGAGLIVRRNVAERYNEDLAADRTRIQFDRRGKSLEGAGDFDLVLSSRFLGLGWGNFPTLRIVHLMPRERTTKEYLLRMIEAASFSLVMVSRKTGRNIPQREGRLKQSARACLIFLTKGWVHVRFFEAQQRGFDRGLKQSEV